MNCRLTEEDDQYYWDTDSMLFYLPLRWQRVQKIAVSPITGTTRARFVRSTVSWSRTLPPRWLRLRVTPRLHDQQERLPGGGHDNNYFLDVDLGDQPVEDTVHLRCR